MKAAILVCTLAASAVAAPRRAPLDPKLSEHARAAEQAWTAAEREHDAAKQPALWEQAAAAFDEVDSDPVDVKVKREAAYAAVIAWKNALAVEVKVTAPPPAPRDEPPKPRPLPARELKLIAALDRYAKYVTDPKDPELPAMLYVKARAYLQFDQTETAIPILRTIVDRYRQHEVTEYAALLVLDAYRQLRQYDQLLTFADELAKDAKFMNGRDDLRARITTIQKQAKRRHVEQLEAAAHSAHDAEKYTAVGTAYLEIYNADPGAADGDELLFNSAVAFESGRALAAAIQSFSLVLKQYPNSKISARALARLARIYGDIAMYDKAAEKLEQYAAKYAGEKDAYDAMSDAIYYRMAIGDRDKAISDTKYFIKTFGAKKPKEAAEAMWALTALYESNPDQVFKHLQEYLRTFGAKGGAAHLVIAHARLGQLLWKQSCPISGFDGLCVKATERTTRTCGQGTVRTLTATARDPGKLQKAMVELALAFKEFERVGGIDDPAARYYYAQAKLIQGDAELERYLAIAFPRQLNFDPGNAETRTKSMRRFSEWLEQKQKAGGTLARRYESVLMIKDTASSITAAERLGIVTETFASALVTGEIPRDVGSGTHGADQVKVYCDALTDVAEPLEAKAVEGFAVCLAKSTELAWFSESSAECERQLIRLKPDEFPRATELRNQALQVAPVIAVEPPL